MILTNIETVPGYRVVELCGFVSGSTVRSKNAIRDLGAGLKNFIGGELKNYTDLLRESRDEATKRMISQAEALGANAVINVRLATASITQGAAEVYAYGTAVKVQKTGN